MVAIVGATGAGKTTVVNLIERFYDPVQGNIFLDGVDLRDWAKHELRSHIGLVMQDVFIFGGSLKDNISLGRNEVDIDTIDLAITWSNAGRFINPSVRWNGSGNGRRGFFPLGRGTPNSIIYQGIGVRS
jgi:ATP-binding cassette subfamily B protein